ncbi:alpha-amylase family protein [Isoptericola sp. BMS4]|uniref:alpha-amylase family protein n=1 Tax=Isoptericola sp. BMS4 TaxID=2527875 RepID=UPI0014247BEE|nr:alpha-amylase family protein [Isoptericola sp. BMS4]
MTFTDARPAAHDGLRTPHWYRTATRWTQLTFTDDDPAVLDVDFWIDVMRRSRSNALCLSAGGYMAFYPTRIPYHHRSAHLGDTDPFGALVDGARRLGMHVMARVDPHAVHQDAADAHPEWLARDAHGDPIPHASMPGLWWTDPFSTYHREFTTEVALEIVREYDVDAVFANRWEGHRGVSYTEETARRFLADSGHRLPREDDPDDPAWPAWTAWQSRRLSELVVLWDDAVRAVRPHVRFIPNRGANLTRDLVPELVGDRYPMFFVDKQGRSGTEAAWEPGRIAKRARGLHPERPVALITSVGPEDHEKRWKDSVADPHETASLVIDGFAQGARPWFTKFKAECFDTRWVAPVVEAFRLHERCEPVLGRLRHTAEVLLLDSRANSGGHRGHEDGVYQALLEARIPFEYIADDALTADRLAEVRVLVLPACPELSADHVRVIEEYVAGGGSVVAAFDSGLTRDGTTIALGDLLGVRLVQGVRGPVKNKYMTIEADHPVAAGYDGTRRIVAGTRVLDVEAAPGAEVVFRFVPDYPDLPMEEVYPRPGDATPAVVAREHPSGGRTVHLAFDAGEVYWESLQSDHGRLLANAVRWALGDEPERVRVDGAGLVDIALLDGDDELAVAVVNLTNPMAMRGQQHELLPLADQEVLVRLPEGAEDVRARLLVDGRTAPVTVTGGTARVHLDRIDRIEVVHLEWRSPTSR